MGSHRGSWLGSSLLAAAIVIAPAGATTVRAQPGFGPDPFWPYNNQYTPYVTPMGPAGPGGGQGGEVNMRNGLRGANQFQNYLENLEGAGPGRNASDRSSIGMPYYRSAVDPSFEDKDRPRQYRPNARTSDSFDDSQQRVADTYFRYYAERDPARRASLLKAYREARRDAAMAIAGRGRSPSRPLDDGAGGRSEFAPRRGARTGAASARTGGAGDRTRAQADRFGPAPEVPAMGLRRSSGNPSPSPRRALPTDVLNRSRAMDPGDRMPSRPSSPLPGNPAARPGDRGLAPAPPKPSTAVDNNP
jgi:hypothetical protein